MNIHKINTLHRQFIKDLETLINNTRVTIKPHSLCSFDYSAIAYSVKYEDITVHFFGINIELISYDFLMDVYTAIIRALPINLKNKYSLDYDRKGYSYLKVTSARYLGFFNCKANRINKNLSGYLYNRLKSGDIKISSQCINKYESPYDFNIKFTFQL